MQKDMIREVNMMEERGREGGGNMKSCTEGQNEVKGRDVYA